MSAQHRSTGPLTSVVVPVIGPARVGKSTTSATLAEVLAGTWVSGDALVDALTSTVVPDLDRGRTHDVREVGAGEWVAGIRARDRRRAPYLIEVGEQTARRQGRTCVLDATVWPADLPERMRRVAVVLVDTRPVPEQVQWLEHVRREAGPNCWQQGWTSRHLTRWAGHNRVRSLALSYEASRYGVLVVDRADYPSADAMQCSAVWQTHARVTEPAEAMCS